MDTREKIRDAFLAQVERLADVVGEIRGEAEAQAIRNDFATPETANAFVNGGLGAAVNRVEQLGRVVDKIAANPADQDVIFALDDIRDQGARTILLAQANVGDIDFYEKVVTRDEGLEGARAQEYWQMPGNERRFTDGITTDEIYASERMPVAKPQARAMSPAQAEEAEVIGAYREVAAMSDADREALLARFEQYDMGRRQGAADPSIDTAGFGPVEIIKRNMEQRGVPTVGMGIADEVELASDLTDLEIRRFVNPPSKITAEPRPVPARNTGRADKLDSVPPNLVQESLAAARLDTALSELAGRTPDELMAAYNELELAVSKDPARSVASFADDTSLFPDTRQLALVADYMDRNGMPTSPNDVVAAVQVYSRTGSLSGPETLSVRPQVDAGDVAIQEPDLTSPDGPSARQITRAELEELQRNNARPVDASVARAEAGVGAAREKLFEKARSVVGRMTPEEIALDMEKLGRISDENPGQTTRVVMDTPELSPKLQALKIFGDGLEARGVEVNAENIRAMAADPSLIPDTRPPRAASPEGLPRMQESGDRAPAGSAMTPEARAELDRIADQIQAERRASAPPRADVASEPRGETDGRQITGAELEALQRDQAAFDAGARDDRIIIIDDGAGGEKLMTAQELAAMDERMAAAAKDARNTKIAGAVGGSLGVGLGALSLANSISEGDGVGATIAGADVGVGATQLAMQTGLIKGAAGLGKALPGIGAAVTLADGAYQTFTEDGLANKIVEAVGTTATGVATVGTGTLLLGGATALGTAAAAPVVAIAATGIGIAYAGNEAKENVKEAIRIDDMVEEIFKTSADMTNRQNLVALTSPGYFGTKDSQYLRDAVRDERGRIDLSVPENLPKVRAAISEFSQNQQKIADDNEPLLGTTFARVSPFSDKQALGRYDDARLYMGRADAALSELDSLEKEMRQKSREAAPEQLIDAQRLTRTEPEKTRETPMVPEVPKSLSGMSAEALAAAVGAAKGAVSKDFGMDQADANTNKVANVRNDKGGGERTV